MAPNNQVQVYTPEILQAFPTEVLQVIRTSICPTATDPEFLLFAHKAALYRLDPFKNEIFFIKYGNQVRIQFAAEAYLAKAREKEGFEPPHTQVVREGDTYKARWNHKEREMEIEFESEDASPGKIIRAYSIAYRTGYRPVTVIVEMSELEHMMTGQNKENWQKWTADMIGKFAEQRALKKQYGLEFGDDEHPQAGSPAVDPYERKDVTPEATKAETPKTTTKQAPKNTAPIDITPEPTDEAKLLTAQSTIADRFKQLGITKNKAAWITENCNVFDVSNMTLEEYESCIKVMDMLIAEKAEQDDQPL